MNKKRVASFGRPAPSDLPEQVSNQQQRKSNFQANGRIELVQVQTRRSCTIAACHSACAAVSRGFRPRPRALEVAGGSGTGVEEICFPIGKHFRSTKCLHNKRLGRRGASSAAGCGMLFATAVRVSPLVQGGHHRLSPAPVPAGRGPMPPGRADPTTAAFRRNSNDP